MTKQRLESPMLGRCAFTALVVAFVAGSCSSSKVCAGNPIACRNYTAAACAKFEGCVAQAACVLVDSETGVAACSVNTTAAACAAPKCSWTGAACVDACSTVTDPAACDAMVGERGANNFLLWTCQWAECTGTPKIKDCSDYSVNMCPAGCAVQTPCNFGDC